MVKIDLITGFLGSGKTTFLKKYARHLMDSGEKIGILENDFGAVNVDMMLLQELMGEKCELEMVSGGYDADCHKRRFKTKLITMAMFGYDRVIVEPSGIYDVDEFFDTLREDPLDNWYEIGNVIAIVDAKLESGMSEQTEYMLASQIANAGTLVLSRSQEAEPEEVAHTVATLNHVLEKFNCKRRFTNDVQSKPWEALTSEDFHAVSVSGYQLRDHVKISMEENSRFQSLFYLDVHLTAEALKEKVQTVLSDASCGHVFRIKGFVKQEDGTWLELNATRQTIRVAPIQNGQEIVIVTGEQLVEERINSYWS